MAFVQKEWVDRIPAAGKVGRRNLKNVETSVETLYDVSMADDATTAGDEWNAENMNDLETRISDVFKSYVLYNSSSGTQSPFTLSTSAANYNYLEIFFRGPNSIYSSVKIYNPNGKKIALAVTTQTSAVIYWYSAYVAVSGSSVTWTNNRGCRCGTSGGGTEVVGTAPIYITSVIGYKY